MEMYELERAFDQVTQHLTQIEYSTAQLTELAKLMDATDETITQSQVISLHARDFFQKVHYAYTQKKDEILQGEATNV